MLDVASFGSFESLISVFYLISIPSSALMLVVVKFVAGYKAENNFGKIHALLKSANRGLFFLGFILFLFFILFSGEIAGFLKIESTLAVMILGLTLVFTLSYTLNKGILQGLQAFKEMSISGIIEVIAKLLIVIALVKIGLGLNGAMAAIFLSLFAGYSLVLFFLKDIFKYKEKDFVLERPEIKEVFNFFVPSFFLLLFVTLYYSIDVIMVKHFLSPELAGQYGALSILGRVIIFAAGIIIAVMFPMAAEAHKKNGNHGLVLRDSLILVSLISASFLFIYTVMPELVIKILIGAKYLPMAPYLSWFGLAMFLFSLVNLFAQYMLSIHKLKHIYLLGSGILLQIVLIYIFHQNLDQIIYIMNGVMLYLLSAYGIYYIFYVRRSN
jgi:O-antigen/teichoic acid export membrane protein